MTCIAVSVLPAAPAMADTLATSTCTDGGGHRWSGRALWRSEYTAAGTIRVHLTEASFTSAASDATTVDYSVKTYEGSGALLEGIGGKDRVFAFAGGKTYLSVNPANPLSAPGHAKVVISVGDGNDGAGNCTMTFVQPELDTTAPPAPPAPAPTTPPPTSPTIMNTPAQAAAIVYGSASGARPYAHPGGLVVAGRDNYEDQGFKDVSAAGGTVLIYLDPVIDNPYGRYHTMLNAASECGPATSRWPGNQRANTWGYLNDFREGSVLQSKFRCVLEKMVAENPHMGGWFLDDVGSRSWFPDISWGGFSDKAAYRAGAVALTKTMRSVADEHGLIFIVNGTWSANDGGGYPDVSRAGNALADGGFVEHHDGEIGFFGPYSCSSQWADQSPITKGKAINYAVTETAAGRNEYVDSHCFAYVNQQADYDTAPMWGTPHATGLPSRVTR